MKFTLPKIPITKMKYRKFSVAPSDIPLDEDGYYLFTRSRDGNYKISYTSNTQDIRRHSYLYCGKVQNPETGKLVKLYKERYVKGHLGYIDMDIKGIDPDTGKYYGVELEGFILVNKDKYFLYDGRCDYYIMEDENDIKHYVKKQENVSSWGIMIRPKDELGEEFKTVYDIKEISW